MADRKIIRENDQYMTSDTIFGVRHVRGTMWQVTKLVQGKTLQHVPVRGERFNNLADAVERMWKLHG